MSEEILPKGLRLFIAVMIPAEVKTEIGRTQAEFRRALSETAVRWTKSKHFHLTLRFLGTVPSERLEALIESVRRLCCPFAPLHLRAERVGFFPDKGFPRVVWVGLRDQTEQLIPLQLAVEAATRQFTKEAGNERFSAHVTLGRAKRIKGREAKILTNLGSDMADRFFGEWVADRIELMQSELSPEGVRHRSLGGFSLLGSNSKP